MLNILSITSSFLWRVPQVLRTVIIFHKAKQLVFVGHQAKKYLINIRQITKQIEREIYLALFFINMFVPKYTIDESSQHWRLEIAIINSPSLLVGT